MKLQAICDCKEDKVIMGNFDGEMIWRPKTLQEMRQDDREFEVVQPDEQLLMNDESWKRQEAYLANSD